MLKLNRRINASVFLSNQDILVVNQLSTEARVEPLVDFHHKQAFPVHIYCSKFIVTREQVETALAADIFHHRKIYSDQ